MRTVRRRDPVYLLMSLAIAAVVAVGFGPTIDARLIHPPSSRPPILYVHVALFTAWVLSLILQCSLVYRGKPDWHRKLGMLGIMIGATLPFVGFETALVMTRLEVHEGASVVEGEAFLAVSLFDMVAFGVLFWTAVAYRDRPQYHRRLILMASCGLTVAAFARFPQGLIPTNGWYLGVDALILVAAVRDRIVEHRWHGVYRLGIPLLAAGQGLTVIIYVRQWSPWLSIAHTLLRAG